MKQGFTLVEMAIVLVIVGLIVGGVMAGRSMVRASELRTVALDYSKYKSAIEAFRSRYNAYPGDLVNATSYWGDQATGSYACADAAVADGTPGTCNGNGDGFMGSGGGTYPEGMRAWQHLGLAGLIEGTYTGYPAAAGAATGVNMPSSKVSGTAAWEILWRADDGSDNIYGYAGNLFVLGQPGGVNDVWVAVIKPDEAMNIDSKMDDGMPGTGIMMAGGDSATCVTPHTIDYGPAGAATPYTRAYDITTTTVECRLWFKI